MQADEYQQENFDKSAALRLEVFTKEQTFDPKLELDEFDIPYLRDDVIHVIAVDSNDLTVGTVRMKRIGQKAHLGRLAVSRQARGTGLGRRICEYAARKVVREWHVTTVVISSQHQVRKFYEGLGYKYNAGKGYYEDEGWSHCEMTQEFDQAQ